MKVSLDNCRGCKYLAKMVGIGLGARCSNLKNNPDLKEGKRWPLKTLNDIDECDLYERINNI